MEDLEPTGFEMSDADYQIFSVALMGKILEEGKNPADNGDINSTLIRWWGLLIDIPAAELYADGIALSNLISARQEQIDGRQALDNEITRLEQKRARP